MNQNSSHSTTVDTDNSTSFDPMTSLQRKQLTIFPLFFLAMTLLLPTFGCAERKDYPLTTSSSQLLSQTTASSDESEVKTSTVTPIRYEYITKRNPQRDTQSAEVSQPGSVTASKKRLVVINTEIDDRVLGSANQLYSLAEQSKAPIDVLIDSPGGYIHHGLYFIQAMKALQAQGIVIRCHVPSFAASMAYVIFTQCTERYALPYAQLLFHPPRIGGKFLLTPMLTVQLAKGLLEIEKVLLNLMIPAMGVSKEIGGDWFVTNYLDERMFTALELAEESPTKWFTVVGRLNIKD